MKKILVLLLFSVILLVQCTKDSDSSGGFKTVGQGGSLARFAIVGNYMYAVDETTLHVFDLANPASPVKVKTVNVGFEIETIFPFKDKLFIGSTTQVHIFTITDPLNPVQLSQAISPTVLRRCDPVVANDTVAFATLRSTGECGGVRSVLSVIDIRDINNPKEKTTFTLPEPFGLGYWNDVLYVCDKTMGLVVFDISNAYNPVVIKSLNDGIYVDVIPYAGTLICWIDKGVIIYDITDNRNPVLLAKIN